MAVTDDTGIPATVHLTRLTERLKEDGLHARVRVASRRPPELIVVNPDAPALSEIVYTAPQEGTWWYWWSWHEKIGPVAEADVVARKIHHVLTPTGRSR
ncbi:hypothetical protein [Streptosporangium minutum]|uniref:Uncharacterized protein n=1 Tax=Streptosporangium minutum TaxID=569862 RepID=A0A243RQ41_9ACTN|nr:hypothetical protein [Streptosporangium minutum]OUC97060.1 hypothetical protein CA984_12645 [Streptosporangium minutum]